MRAQKWTLLKHFDGEPKDEDIQLEEFDLTDDLQENEVLTEALYLSVDPHMRPYSARFSVPMTMIGEQVAQVIKSKNEKFKWEQRYWQIMDGYHIALRMDQI